MKVLQWVGLASGLALAVSFGAKASAKAQFETGNSLYDYCKDESGSFHSGVCNGYIVAVVDALVNELCVPASVTKGQMREIVVLFLKNNPQYRHFGAQNIVSAATKQAFPCQ